MLLRGQRRWWVARVVKRPFHASWDRLSPHGQEGLEVARLPALPLEVWGSRLRTLLISEPPLPLVLRWHHLSLCLEDESFTNQNWNFYYPGNYPGNLRKTFCALEVRNQHNRLLCSHKMPSKIGFWAKSPGVCWVLWNSLEQAPDGQYSAR